MKTVLFGLFLFASVSTLQAQAPIGSKLAAEQAFTKELNRVFAYQKEHLIANAAASIKAPSLGSSGILTLTFSLAGADVGCREVTTIPVDKIASVISDSIIGFRMDNAGVQKIRLCSGKQPTKASENILVVATINDETAAKALATDLEAALRQLQAFYK